MKELLKGKMPDWVDGKDVQVAICQECAIARLADMALRETVDKIKLFVGKRKAISQQRT
jgi:homoaconitase/3-isopropylmalate dehydratase large subunit